MLGDNYSSDWPELTSDWPIMGTVTWVRGQGRCELGGGNFTALLVYCPSRQGRENCTIGTKADTSRMFSRGLF